MNTRHVLRGNDIVAKAALYAGCDFYAGYPITPSSEIAQYMSKVMPEMGRAFIQMEDEIASLGACIGAALTGKKSLTATSGPGFSLMQEHFGMATMIEVPLVIVNVMRGGPSTGLPTKAAQSDMMQARWGTHGDHPVIALYPAFSDEIFSETVRAFNLAEKYRTPVILLLDEILAKAHEDISIPSEGALEVYNAPHKKIDDLNIYDRPMGEVAPHIHFFSECPIHVESLEHDGKGWPTVDPATVDNMQHLRMQKIYQNLDDIITYNEYELDDAEIMIFSFGISARSSLAAVQMARESGLKVGLFQALTVWPFPTKALQKHFQKIKKVLTVEMNMGQMKYEVERVAPGDVVTKTLLRANGVPFAPQEILNSLKEMF